MLSAWMKFIKTYLPDWPEWALDVLLIMTGLLIVTGGLCTAYTPAEEQEDAEYKATHTTSHGSSSSSTASTTTTTQDYDKLSLIDLRAEGKKRGLKVADGISMDGLIKKLQQADVEHEKTATAHHLLLTKYHAFRQKYITVYSVIMLADWMQGTHMYTLYMSYGVNVSALFLTGFLSGGIFAPFLGSFVDQFGRKRSCIVYCLLEIAINVMEGYDNFNILMAGRVLGGVSTNLLFSAFESWMTTEHRRQGFPDEWLSRTYSQCSIVNGSTAIAAGIVAQFLEDAFGHIGPFHGAVGLTALALMLVLGWEENYGEEHAGDHNRSSLVHQFVEGWKTTMSDSRIWRIGLTQALSEGAMYTFVFMWVPTLLSLEPPGGVPTGCVFSALMMSITMGGLVFPPLQAFITWTLRSKESSSELCASLVYLLAAASMAVPVFCLSPGSGVWSTGGDAHICQEFIIASFLIVEFCVGLFMPVAGTLRSKYVPDNLQGAILNIFRLPLNTIVVSGTYATNVLEPSLVFKLVSGCFFAAALLQATMIPQSSSSRTATTAGKKKTE